MQVRMKLRGYHEGLLSGSIRWRTDRSAPCYAWEKCLAIFAAATASRRYDTTLALVSLNMSSSEQASLYLWLTVCAENTVYWVHAEFSHFLPVIFTFWVSTSHNASTT